ncbi:MAG: ISAs1 family transposase [Kaiparowitsia implicata GSE-PSE-MK54-09C]|nr:ISAs1 family transposase [Kaiparowitsia implicata GSE-PSE-MK54-09C]
MGEIARAGNYYCIGLKANQPKLLKQAQQCQHTQVPLSFYQALDTSHGRVVQQRVQIFEAPVEFSHDWVGLAAFVLVERSGVRDGKPFSRQAWFITNQVIDAQQAALMIQAHRGSTENKLHWVKDVVQGEDGSSFRAPNPATLMALLRSWAVSLFRKAGHASITKAIRRFQHNLPKLLSLL